ncbi:MAG: hypothetical protein IPJ30_06590 [Acidobacteria bacterium]|nr:hypothetical protein [Acidobacteriota bacterium]
MGFGISDIPDSKFQIPLNLEDVEFLESGIWNLWNLWNLESLESGIWNLWNLESGISGIWNFWNLESLESGISGIWNLWNLESLESGIPGISRISGISGIPGIWNPWNILNLDPGIDLMKKLSLVLCLIAGVSAVAFGQPRPAEKTKEPAAAVRPAPASFVAKYEGGMFGYSRKEEGTLKFDDENERLVFLGKDQKEKFAIPYKSMLVVFPQSQSVQSTTGKVVSVIPYAGLLGGFIKEKRQYLIVNFDDPDVDAKGMVNFKLADRELLDSVIAKLAEEAELKQRGEAFYRPKAVKIED